MKRAALIWRRLLIALVALIASAAPALAGPVFVALLSGGASVGSAFAATAVGTFLTSTVGRLLTTVALTALSSAMQPKTKAPGIVVEETQSGGTNPQSFVLGRYATGGYAVGPAMSHGDSLKQLTYVIDLGDIPITSVERLILDEEYVTVDWADTSEPNGYGSPVRGRLDGYAWLKVYTGTQTVADAMLRAKYGSYPTRPWLSDMVGLGVPYAILTSKYNTERFQGRPSVRFEVKGIKLYDPRKDTTVGGSGAHRWSTPSTWEWSENPVVMIYNILRGIALADGSRWGGKWTAGDLPLDSWFAGMNACDESVAKAGGGTEPRYRSGYEVRVKDEPADVIEELMKGCSARIAITGGKCKIRVGAPGLPVYFLTDDDVVRSRPEELDPFPSLSETYNAIHASYPEPESLWEAKDAPPRYNAGWETDDNDRRLVAELNLPTVPYATQVQRLMKAYIDEERRFRRHSVNLPPEAVVLEPLDTLSWTSTRNGYAAKLFEVSQTADDPMTLIQGVTLREVDASDYDWTVADELPTTIASAAPVEPAPFEVLGFAVTPETISDGTTGRRPAVRLSWTAGSVDGAKGLIWELRRVGDTVVLSGATQDVATGRLVLSEGVLPATGYEVRARLVADALTVWTSWVSVTSPAVRLAEDDIRNDAISRPLIRQYAVSEVWQAIALGPFQIPSALTVRATLALGPVGFGALLRAGAVVEARDPSGLGFFVRVSRRDKVAGVWSSWIDLSVLAVNRPGWYPYSFSGNFSAAVEDSEYRVSTDAGHTGYVSTDAIRNIYITVADVVK